MADTAMFQLLDIESEFALEFPLFPEQITTSGRANWEPQEVTMGKKPLFYANTDPLRISINEVYFDYTDSNVSAAPDIDLMRYLMTEFEGKPPGALLAIWGEREIRCVLTDLTIEETMFNDDGNPTRLKCSLELLELQEDGEATNVSVYTEDIY